MAAIARGAPGAPWHLAADAHAPPIFYAIILGIA